MSTVKTFLKSNNLKVTPQRLKLISIIEEKGHVSIDELYSLIKNEFENISLATIYKNLNLMIEKGCIQEVKIDCHKSIYEISKKEHNHLICNNCFSITDISIPKSNLDLSNIDINFNIQQIKFNIYGTCSNCLEN